MKNTPPILALLIVIGLSPLMRFSLEGTALPRGTEIILGICIIALAWFFLSYHYRVQSTLRISFFVLLIGIASAIVIGLFAPQANALLYWILALCFGTAIWIIRTTHSTSRNILAMTLIGCIGIYAQWGIAQFIVQHDLGMHVTGESRLGVGIPGVASFSHGSQKYIRSYGPFAHSNSFAGTIILGIILLYCIQPSSKMYCRSIMFVYTLGILISFSRTALVSLLLLACIFYIQRRSYWIMGIIVVPLLLFSPLLLVRSVDPNGVALEDRATGVSWLKDMTTPKSLLRGYGIGNYERALSSYLDSNHISHNPWDIAPVHSVPLLLFSELGVLLGGAFVLLLGMFFILYSSPVLLVLVPPLLLDHYFLTQFGPLLFLITCTLLVVQYRDGHRTH